MILVRFKLFLASVYLLSVVSNASPDWLKDYEFKSYYCLDDVYFFSLYNRTSFSSIWLEQGKERHGISVLDFEADTNNLSLSFNNQIGELKLLKPETSAINGVYTAKNSDSSKIYEEAVKIAAKFQLQNPGADIMEAPIPSSIRTSLLQNKKDGYENSNVKSKLAYTSFTRSVGLERRRLIREKIRSNATKMSH